MNVTFIGHGYVGLVTACVFADFGNTVRVVGHTPAKLARLSSGDPIIYEPGLRELLQKNLAAGRIMFTDKVGEAVAPADVIFIAVGTPPKENGEADLSMVMGVAHSIAKHLKKGFTVVSCKSTVPVGTNKMIESILNKEKPDGAEIAVASCPEFLREGSAINDTFFADRVVIGSASKEAVIILQKLHEPITGKKIVTDLASAELIKYTSNSMLAVKISFANLISFYCEKTGADVETVLDAVGLDKRIGRIFMDPGVGYGGSCFPKDVRALIDTGRKYGLNANFLQEAENINEEAALNFLSKIKGAIKGKTLGVWGLSFKPNTDDIRFAPSLIVIEALLKEGYAIRAFDPAAMENVKKKFGDKITYFANPYDVADKVDGLAIFAEWNEFKHLDLTKVKSKMNSPLIFDGRNIYNPATMQALGFNYYSTGRQPVLV